MTERRTIVLLFLTAVVVRSLLHLVFADDLVVGSDQIDYINLGRGFAAGHPGGLLDPYWPPLLPFLIGMVGLFIEGLTLPAIVVAVVAGSLVVPVTYYLARQFYDATTAKVAAVIAIFYPHLLNATFAAGSENVYVALIGTCLITGWKAITSASTKYGILTGVLLGLAYLTRPEAFAYPAFFIALILLKGLVGGISFKTSARLSAALLVAFVAIATPYLIYLKTATGTWTISGKTGINTVLAEPGLLGPGEGKSASDQTPAILLAAAVGSNLLQVSKALPILAPLPIVIFIALGLFSADWSPDRTKWELLLIGFCLLSVAGYVVAVVQTRYFFILLPIFSGWAAKGIFAFSDWFYRTTLRLKNQGLVSFAGSYYLPSLCLALLFVYLLPLNFFVTSSEAAWRDRPYEERAAGLWLRENAGPGTRVFSARKVPAFYGEAVQVPPTSTDFENVFEAIHGGDVDFVVAGRRELSRNPYLRDLESRMQSSPQFEMVYTNTEHPEYPISIFKRRDREGVSSQPK